MSRPGYGPGAWLRAALSPDIVRGALAIALVVGIALNLINQSERVTLGQGLSLPHLFLNFLVPYLVATWSGARAALRQKDTEL